jgi:putative ABC transport system permease protein
MLPSSQFLLTVWLGFKSLALHKLRSFLTMLGILIGVMSVVWLLAMGEGVSEKVQEQIRELGATNIMVRSIKPPTDPSDASAAGSFFAEYGIKRADYQRITTTMPSVVRALPIREFPKEFRYLHRSVNGRLVGCTPEYLDVNHLRMADGRFLSTVDCDQRANYCVIAHGTAEALFPFEDPIGKSVLIDTDFYVILGRTEERMPSAAIGGSLAAQDFNLDVYIPINTWRTRIGDEIMTASAGAREGEILELSQITVTVRDVSEVMETKAIIESLMRMYHKKQDWGVTAPLELLEQARIMRLIFNVLLVLIATISLVVGGIGIMNIMLATVTERTREIGIRRALGARRSDITRQFLVETIVLSALGGFVGALGGLLCKPVVVAMRDLLARFFPDTWRLLPPVVQTLEPSTSAYAWSVPIAFGIAVLIGVLFGLYPARRAALMDPIEALRHE